MRQIQKRGKRLPGFKQMNTNISDKTCYFHLQGGSLPLLQCPFPKQSSITSQKLAVVGYREVHRWLTRDISGGTATATAVLTLSKS